VNIVLIVIDSLRTISNQTLRTPFFDRLFEESACFQRAYATECWTLPSHVSMFTGLLPSEHGAHFQCMAYAKDVPTVAERLGSKGFYTEVVTRNFVFDGTIPGVTHGFQVLTQPRMAVHPWNNAVAMMVAISKPRVRRLLRSSGFFHPRHAVSRAFVRDFARVLLPADRPALERVLAVMRQQNAARRPYFVFANLYDVHAPYAPRADSLLRSWSSLSAIRENLAFPFLMQMLSEHRYLCDEFRVPSWSREALLGRYRDAIERVDGLLGEFYESATYDRLLEDTLLIVTSDHGEAFGDHDLYLHDASVWNTHLHVPLWIRHPSVPVGAIEEVVSLRDLPKLITAAASGQSLGGTILDPEYRSGHPLAIAEHFHYTGRRDIGRKYRQNLLALIGATEKVIILRDSAERYDLTCDAEELRPNPASPESVERLARRSGALPSVADGYVAHLGAWRAAAAAGVGTQDAS
jgi:arylsulfatase A-like enzyme